VGILPTGAAGKRSLAGLHYRFAARNFAVVAKFVIIRRSSMAPFLFNIVKGPHVAM